MNPRVEIKASSRHAFWAGCDRSKGPWRTFDINECACAGRILIEESPATARFRAKSNGRAKERPVTADSTSNSNDTKLEVKNRNLTETTMEYMQYLRPRVARMISLRLALLARRSQSG